MSKAKPKKGKGKDEEAPAKGRARSPIQPFRWAVITAAIIGGYPLLTLVETGGLSPEAALLRFAAISGICLIGYSLLKSLVTNYQASAMAHRRAARKRAIELAAVLAHEQKIKEAEAAVEATRNALENRKQGLPAEIPPSAVGILGGKEFG